ncbi:hypothetical protein B0H11DRAFT_2424866 [Mycena galericulata]|nr:hypothetical protein B0H11DRAFT_2424866 [Mycena galericulata]
MALPELRFFESPPEFPPISFGVLSSRMRRQLLPAGYPRQNPTLCRRAHRASHPLSNSIWILGLTATTWSEHEAQCTNRRLDDDEYHVSGPMFGYPRQNPTLCRRAHRASHPLSNSIWILGLTATTWSEHEAQCTKGLLDPLPPPSPTFPRRLLLVDGGIKRAGGGGGIREGLQPGFTAQG